LVPLRDDALRLLVRPTDEFEAFPRSLLENGTTRWRPTPEMSAITHLFAGVPVSDLDASIDWYTRFSGRPPASRVGEEILWEIDERAWLFIEPNAARAGAGRITLAVAGLDALLERLAAHRIEHEPIETYSNGVRHVNVPDPDGNAIAFAEPPDAASASPRSAGPRASS
jgi:catechol 2,3-dioxygenase-like lactoylglutathione lyase family enzyme